MDWKQLKGREKYHAYLASREWALLKKAVRERAGGKCEKCGSTEHLSTHHLTYARVYEERLDDLQLLCEKCHQHESGVETETKYITDLFVQVWKPENDVLTRVFYEAARSSNFDIQAFIIDYARIALDPEEFGMDDMTWDCRNLVHFDGQNLRLTYGVPMFRGEESVIVFFSHEPAKGAKHIQLIVSEDGKREVKHLGEVK